MQKTSSKNMDLTRDFDYFEHSPSAQPKLLNENSYIQETIIICPFTYLLFLSYCSQALNTFFRTKVYMSNVCREFYEIEIQRIRDIVYSFKTKDVIKYWFVSSG